MQKGAFEDNACNHLLLTSPLQKNSLGNIATMYKLSQKKKALQYNKFRKLILDGSGNYHSQMGNAIPCSLWRVKKKKKKNLI